MIPLWCILRGYQAQMLEIKPFYFYLILFGYVVIFLYICINLNYKTMQALSLKETINIKGKTFYHYSLGGKYFAKEWIVVDDITYYDAVRQAE